MASLLDSLDVYTRKCICCLRDRFALCIAIHNQSIDSLRESLQKPMYAGDRVLQRRRVRGDRNAGFMDASHHFVPVGLLGRGGFGEVSLVSAKSDPTRLYALKKQLFPARRPLRSCYHKLATEKDALLRLRSEHVIALKASWVEAGHVDRPDAAFLLCEFMARGSLLDLLEQLHPVVKGVSDLRQHPGSLHALTAAHGLDFKRLTVAALMEEVRILRLDEELRRRLMSLFLHYTERIVAMVGFLHAHEVVHQDLKPHNILVSADLRLKLADLGSASAFLPSHHLPQFDWLAVDQLSDAVGESYPVFGAEEQSLEFAKHRRKAARRAKIPGTRYFCPPESLRIGDEQWRANTNVPRRQFPVHRHFKHDWWSVGCILHDLYTGMHPFLGAFALLDRPNDAEGWTAMILAPHTWCGLLYTLPPPSPPPDLLVIDPRLLLISRALTRVDIGQRWDGAALLADAEFRALQAEFRAGEAPLWTWNEFRETPAVSRTERMIRHFQEHGEAIDPRLLDEEEAPTQNLPDFHRIPELPGFSCMDVSPGSPATPSTSPASRLLAATSSNLDQEE